MSSGHIKEPLRDVHGDSDRYVNRWRKPRPVPGSVVSNRKKSVVNRNLFVDFLTICFGTGTWIAINGLFVQLPLLVQTQPEGWNLPSYISLVVQAANIGPVLYMVSHRLWPGKFQDSTIIYSLLTVGSISVFMLALFYKETVYVFGLERSIPLLTLVFFIALVGCTSSVLFMPYMGNFHEIYLISYFVGEGLSGFVPSVVSLAQGAGGNPTCSNSTQPDGTVLIVPYIPLPNFSTQVFLLFLFGIMICSTIAFSFLNYLRSSSLGLSQRVNNCPEIDKTEDCYKAENKDSSLELTEYLKETSELFSEIDRDSTSGANGVRPTTIPAVDRLNISTLTKLMSSSLLFVVAWVSLLGNGIFPSIQSYSCLPYGNTVYHFSATLGSMANPAACFLAFFLPISSPYKIFKLALLSALVSCYISLTAFTSPAPPLLKTIGGEILIVSCWVLNTGLISFVKMSIAALYRRQGGRALFWCGAVQQLGSALGALVAFFLINFTSTFTSYHDCE